jgi:hypothetical protein
MQCRFFRNYVHVEMNFNSNLIYVDGTLCSVSTTGNVGQTRVETVQLV